MTEPEKELTTAIRTAVADAIKEVLTDKDAVAHFWEAAFDRLQERATESTGRWVLGGFRAILAKASMYAAVAMLVYSLGGWTAVLKLWHAVESVQ